MELTMVSSIEIPEGNVTQIHTNGQCIWARSQDTTHPDYTTISNAETE